MVAGVAGGKAVTGAAINPFYNGSIQSRSVAGAQPVKVGFDNAGASKISQAKG